MDIIEQGLQRVDAQHEAILDAARLSQRCGANLDCDFQENFPEIQTHTECVEKAPVFNPTTVVEMRDGKAYQVLEAWDKTIGILPGRVVTGAYHIDFGKEFNDGFYFSENFNLLFNAPRYCSFRCNCPNLTPYNHLRIQDRSQLDVKRGYERPFFFSWFYDYGEKYLSQDFEVDNYLNLYHPRSGLYLLFNKTVFPGIAFHLYNPLKECRPFFKSKRVQDEVTYNLTTQALDPAVQNQRQVFLSAISSIVPEDYTSVFGFYDRLRRFKGVDDAKTLQNKDQVLSLTEREAEQLALRATHAQELRTQELNVETLKKENAYVQYLYNILIMNCADGKLKIRDLETTTAEQAITITRLRSVLEEKHSEISMLRSALKECGAKN